MYLHVDCVRNEWHVRIPTSKCEANTVQNHSGHGQKAECRVSLTYDCPRNLRRNVSLRNGWEHDHDVQHHCLHGIETDKVMQLFVLDDSQEDEEENNKRRELR